VLVGVSREEDVVVERRSNDGRRRESARYHVDEYPHRVVRVSVCL
jgi:hypothetical protein